MTNITKDAAIRNEILRATLERDGSTCWNCSAELRPGFITVVDIPLAKPDPDIPFLRSRTRALCPWCAEGAR